MFVTFWAPFGDLQILGISEVALRPKGNFDIRGGDITPCPEVRGHEWGERELWNLNQIRISSPKCSSCVTIEKPFKLSGCQRRACRWGPSSRPPPRPPAPSSITISLPSLPREPGALSAEPPAAYRSRSPLPRGGPQPDDFPHKGPHERASSPPTLCPAAQGGSDTARLYVLRVLSLA